MIFFLLFDKFALSFDEMFNNNKSYPFISVGGWGGVGVDCTFGITCTTQLSSGLDPQPQGQQAKF